MRPRPSRLAVCIAILHTGCVSAMPALSGGRLTPEQRSALHVGASSRIPFGRLRPESAPENLDERFIAIIRPGGIVPVAMARYGLARRLDLEVTISGASVRSAVRTALELEPGGFNHWPRIELMGGLGAYGGIVQDDDGDSTHYGFDVPLVIGIDWASLYEFWAGVRGGLERINGTLDPTAKTLASEFSGFTWRAGLVVGIALGFRNFHGLLELTAYYETMHASIADRDHTLRGISLIPAFSLRWRI
ncbi:MAG: hypothetical protein H6715_02245 [Myxococcales bacterium]|nr:hypothetical protein [Myxococcales bacterium]MCB9707493.1 hypothetical protein [Myxococcales bacterium]